MGGKSHGRLPVKRYQCKVEFSAELYGALEEFANRNDLPLNLSARLLIERGLRTVSVLPPADAEGSFHQQLRTLGCSALATLIAIEQNQKLLISMLPDGEQRAEELWGQAATSARSRLIRVDEALAEETT